MSKIHPITFSIPSEKIVSVVPLKNKIVSTLIPGDLKTYVYNDEESYYDQYKESMFAITTMKGGWDCLRHYEILACGSIPYFINIENCPTKTLALFPKDLIIKGNKLFETIKNNNELSIPNNLMSEYYELTNQLLRYTHENLTTESMATYILKTINRENVENILYLSQDISPDYLRCLTLHGFKKIFGLKCSDFPKIPHIYKNCNISKDKLYGKGFTYSKLLDETLHNDRETEYDIIDNIKNKKYDLIIYGSYHRGIPYYDYICKFYKAEDVVFLCGEDFHNCNYNIILNKGHHVFVRELI